MNYCNNLGSVEPEVFVFEGQKQEEAEKLIEEMNSQCDMKSVYEKIQETNPELNVLNKTEIYKFFNQDKEGAEKLIRFMDEQACCEKYKNIHHVEIEPKLINDDGSTEDIPNIFELKDRLNTEVDCYEACNYRKLAGLTEETTKDLESQFELEDKVIKVIQGKFNDKNFNLSWEGDCICKNLKINDFVTKFKTSDLYEIQKGLTKLVSENEANNIIAEIIMKKLKEIF